MRRDPSPSMLACVGSVAAVLVAALSVLGIKYGQGEFEPTYEVSAVFPSSAQGVFTDGATDVKLRGVNVGTVSGVELLPDGRARLTLEIDKGIEVPATTSARLEPLSVFGPKFVSLEPGDGEVGGPFLADGGEIAVAETGTELTDVKQDFKLFSPEGTPLRAVLTLQIAEYKPLHDQLQQLNLMSPDHTRSHVLERGETLASVAADFYLNPARWRLIADENGIEDPRRVNPGIDLALPPVT